VLRRGLSYTNIIKRVFLLAFFAVANHSKIYGGEFGNKYFIFKIRNSRFNELVL
jgi:hypothetical protein